MATSLVNPASPGDRGRTALLEGSQPFTLQEKSHLFKAYTRSLRSRFPKALELLSNIGLDPEGCASTPNLFSQHTEFTPRPNMGLQAVGMAFVADSITTRLMRASMITENQADEITEFVLLRNAVRAITLMYAELGGVEQKEVYGANPRDIPRIEDIVTEHPFTQPLARKLLTVSDGAIAERVIERIVVPYDDGLKIKDITSPQAISLCALLTVASSSPHEAPVWIRFFDPEERHIEAQWYDKFPDERENHYREGPPGRVIWCRGSEEPPTNSTFIAPHLQFQQLVGLALAHEINEIGLGGDSVGQIALGDSNRALLQQHRISAQLLREAFTTEFKLLSSGWM